MKYFPTIGLEVHAELHTKSKMFCGCKNEPHGSEPNAHTCPVCLAHPGTLPVPNKEAIKMVLQFGQAVGSDKADFSEFDRKNYFYPDIPKAYQISQYAFPFLTGGELRGVELTRVHLEEDTARSSHDQGENSLVDFNRAGVPLMELVTEPVLHDAKTAGDFARELQLLLRTLGISEANMEKGEMRVEANISISPVDGELGTKVEVKNINSFKAVEAAIDFEIKRHTELLDNGKVISQETRGWDENKSQTFSQRSKETAKDYRYFPDPDIPKLKTSEIPEFDSTEMAENMPILPSSKRELYGKYKISDQMIETIIADRSIDSLFAQTLDLLVAAGNDDAVQLAANYASVDVPAMRAAQSVDAATDIQPQQFAELITLAHARTIGSRGAKDLLPQLFGMVGSVEDLATKQGLIQKSDPAALKAIVDQVISENADQVAECVAGKETVFKYLVGQGMKLSKGSANPAVLEQLLRDEITK
jgi:aspartyl-tRNA(Asn)/glutamyl-tRNA(Gln) amidotransferase subunit B